MLSIDLKTATKRQSVESPEPNPAALNQYNSLNRAQRIRSLARIVDDNKHFLGRLQAAKPHYLNQRWTEDYEKQ